MTYRPVTTAALLTRDELVVGALLAEGGEGRVFALPDRPDQVYKEYRSPQSATPLEDLVSWSGRSGAEVAARLTASTAWPIQIVAATDSAMQTHSALGLVMPRAPRRFSLRHRDGQSHLATLSYLAADPKRRSAAYGLALPDAFSAQRIGLVYALARLVEAFEWPAPSLSHGDLSAKNLLWSLSRGPEVFLLDCDNGALFADQTSITTSFEHGPGRRRAMTPNWDDPSIVPGTNPGQWSDRYSLALIFCRVVAAAHYPLQRVQKGGERIEVGIDVPGPLRKTRSLAAGAEIWEMCARGLSMADPSGRPPASAWVAALRLVLAEIGATAVLDSVAATQGRTELATAVSTIDRRDGSELSVGSAIDVVVRPVTAAIRPRAGRVPAGVSVEASGLEGEVSGSISTVAQGGRKAGRTSAGGILVTGGVGITRATSAGPPGPGRTVGRPPPTLPWRSHARRLLASFVGWLILQHRRSLAAARTPGRRGRAAIGLVWCAGLDAVVLALSLFALAMVVSPFLGV